MGLESVRLPSHDKAGMLSGMRGRTRQQKAGTDARAGERTMLTDTQCRNAKPKDKPYKLPDGKGLYLEVKPNGVKAWRYRFKLVRDGERKESVFAIGDYAAAPARRNRRSRRRRGATADASPWPKRARNAQRRGRW